MLPERNFSDMDREAVARADTARWIAVLPLGAHEQHGPHLPFETDAIIADGVSRRLADAVSDTLPVTFLPVEPVGYSPEHMDFPGSRTLGFGEAVSRWVGIGEMLAGLGIQKLLLLNAHGGNAPLMTIAATEMRARFGMLCVATSWTRFVEAGPMLSAEEKSFGIHGGDVETSVMLALSPDQVALSRAADFDNFQKVLAERHSLLRAYGPHAFGWKMQDLNPVGVTGNAAAATAEKGEAFLDAAVNGLATLVAEMDAFDMNDLRRAPAPQAS